MCCSNAQNIRAALSKFDLDSMSSNAVVLSAIGTYKPQYDEGSTYPIYNEFAPIVPEPELAFAVSRCYVASR